MKISNIRTGVFAFVLTTASMVQVAQAQWSVTGNSATDTAVNFIGTTDNKGLKIKTNSNTRMYIDKAGKIGIGTLSPQTALDLYSASVSTAFGIRSDGGSAFIFMDKQNATDNATVSYRTDGIALWQTGTFANNDFAIKNLPLGNSITVLNSNNFVGIGTTAPVTRLHIVGDGRIQGNLHVTNNSSFGASMSVSGNITSTGAVNSSTLNITGLSQLGDTISFGSAERFIDGGSNTIAANSNLIPETSGNRSLGSSSNSWSNAFLSDALLIGTGTPLVPLEINNGTDLNLTGGGYIQTGATAGANIIIDNNEIVARNAGAAGTLFIGGLGGSVRMCNNAVGNVGIGPVVPTQRLHVSGNILVEDGDIYLGPTNGAINAGGGLMDALVNLMADVDNHSVVNGDEDLYIEDALEVGTQAYKPGGGSFATISDARLKKDIKKYKDGLEQLLKISPVTFKYNDKVKFLNPDKEYVGIIAQEMQKVAPYMIEEKALFSKSHEDKDGNMVVDDAGQNFLTYDGSALTYMLVNAVKEQNGMIEKIQSENESLKKQLMEMQECVASICENATQSKISNIEVQSSSILFQNQPNPFNQSTIIRYQLWDVNSGIIIIRDLNGNLVKQISIAQSGKGQVTINANELAQGTYTYTLEIDGSSIDTKLMVVTK